MGPAILFQAGTTVQDFHFNQIICFWILVAEKSGPKISTELFPGGNHCTRISLFKQSGGGGSTSHSYSS